MTKWEEDSQEPIVNKCVKNFFVFLSLIENSCTDGSNYVPILQAAMGFFSTNDLRSQIPTFLGVRSTNPLPEASGLEKLTRYSYQCTMNTFDA